MARRIKTFGGQKETLPIKSKKQLNALMDYAWSLVEHAKTSKKYYLAYRNYMLILIGINTAFRAEDLLQLKVFQLLKGYISIKENKTGKTQNFRMRKEFYDEVMRYIEEFELKPNDYLFMGQKKKQTYKKSTYNIIYPLTRQQGRNIVRKMGDAVNIDFTFGLHSLRKTFGYMYIFDGGKPETLMKMYNHDDYNYTMRYVHWGIDDAEADREATFYGRTRTRKIKK